MTEKSNPARRMRHGQRPEQELYWPEAGQPRRWAALITSSGRGVLQEYGTTFEHALPGQEVIEVMEMVPGAGITVLTDERIAAGGRWLCDQSADACGVNRDDNWKVYGNEYIKEFRGAAIAAFGAEIVPAQAAPKSLLLDEILVLAETGMSQGLSADHYCGQIVAMIKESK